MKSWLKGGLIGIGILVFLYLFVIIISGGNPEFLLVLPNLPVMILRLITGINILDFRCPFINLLPEETAEPVILSPLTQFRCGGIQILILACSWFLLGALIGWLIGKLKKKTE